MESENTKDFDRTIATFARPRYELMATDDVFEGEAEVRAYHARSRGDVPDQRNENSVLRSTDDGVVVEFDLLGTHAVLGTTFRSSMVALFLFEDGGDRFMCERAYFDTASIRQQLLGGAPGASSIRDSGAAGWRDFADTDRDR